MTTDDFASSMIRIHSATGTRTQVELAALLGIKQSSISDAKKRQSVPAEWFLKLLRSHKLNPEWILTGQGARFMAPSYEGPNTVTPEVAPMEPAKPDVPELVRQLWASFLPRRVKITIEEIAPEVRLMLPAPVMEVA